MSNLTSRNIHKNKTWFTVNPVLSGHSKDGLNYVFKNDNRLMQAESITECSGGAFCNTFDLH